MSLWNSMAERPPIDITAGGFASGGGDQCLSPDKTKYWMTGLVGGDYALGWIDVATNTFGGYVMIADNFAPFQLLISPDGAYAYTIKQPAIIGPPVQNEVYKIDLSDGSTVAFATPVGTLLWRFEMTPDGAFLTYGAARDAAGTVSSNVWQIDTSTMTLAGLITTVGGGYGLNGEMAFTSDSATALACGSGNFVFVVDMATFAVTTFTALPTGHIDPYQCWMSADDSTCWVAMQNNTGTLYDAVVPYDMAGGTWGTPVVLNASTTAVSPVHLGPLRFVLSDDETAILFSHVDDYWRAVDMSSTVLKTVSLAEGVSSAVGWHSFGKVSDTKFYIGSTDLDLVIWVEGGARVQVMRWW